MWSRRSQFEGWELGMEGKDIETLTLYSSYP